MKRLALVLLLVLAACGGTKTPAATRATTSTTSVAFAHPADAKHQVVNGTDVWVSEGDRTIYVSDCDLAKALTAEGAQFGPSHRDAEGNYTPGYGSACPFP